MTPYYSEDGIEIYHGDCREVLPALPENRFDTCITDPPYHLTANKKGGTGPATLNLDSPAGRSRIGTGFMGKAWDGGDVAFKPETWAAVLRVCKPGAILMAFGGTRTFHRLTCAIEDGGWEIRDCMSWLYGSGFPKSLDISKAIDKAAGEQRDRIRGVRSGVVGDTYAQDAWSKEFKDSVLSNMPITAAVCAWNGWGTALKPAWEPIIVAMKPLDGTFAENAQKWDVGGLNIDGGRIEGAPDPASWTTKRDPNAGHGHIGQKRKNIEAMNAGLIAPPSGRWPANVILDEEAARQLDASTDELKGGASINRNRTEKTNAVYGKYGVVNEDVCYGDSGGASRFFYTAKASRSDRGHSNTHPTVKPTDLIKYICKLTATPTGGEIIDPFGGSMTTLVAAREVCRRATAIELELDHCRIGVDRLRQGMLFTPARS